jgi:transcriptional regulator with XRE-family HTH domain
LQPRTYSESFKGMTPQARAPGAESVEAIAERLKATREAMGFNQAQWCRLVGIETAAWNNYEIGLRRISIDQAIKVCQATGVTTDWIYRGLMSAGLPVNVQTALQRNRGKRH